MIMLSNAIETSSALRGEKDRYFANQSRFLKDVLRASRLSWSFSSLLTDRFAFVLRSGLGRWTRVCDGKISNTRQIPGALCASLFQYCDRFHQMCTTRKTATSRPKTSWIKIVALLRMDGSGVVSPLYMMIFWPVWTASNAFTSSTYRTPTMAKLILLWLFRSNRIPIPFPNCTHFVCSIMSSGDCTGQQWPSWERGVSFWMKSDPIGISRIRLRSRFSPKRDE